MHKTTIALGTALLCTAGAHAQSTVQITGTVDAFAGAMKMAGDASRQPVVNSGGLTSSWFGFKGSEDRMAKKGRDAFEPGGEPAMASQ